MGQSEMAGFICGQCGARYSSERELNEHLKAAAHHEDSSEQGSSHRDDTQKDDSKIPLHKEQKTNDREGAQDKVVPGEADLRKAAKLARG